MRRNEHNKKDGLAKPAVASGYAAFQLAKALMTEIEHGDPETRARARRRIEHWATVFNGILIGTLAVGSRTPVRDVPAWVSLKVLTGGFATRDLLAAGPLQAHERTLLSRLSPTPDEDARLALNRYYLTDEGLGELDEMLRSGRYAMNLPEEGALLVVAWLTRSGHVEPARELLETLAPWLSRLRFYPIPTDASRRAGSRVFVQNVGSTIESLKRVGENPRILAQKEAVTVWAPLYDRMVQLFLTTVEGDLPALQGDPDDRRTVSGGGRFPVRGGWPCQRYPDGWAPDAAALLREYDAMRAEHQRCGRPARGNRSLAQLTEILRRCVDDPAALQGRDVGRIRLILARYLARRGSPDSTRCRDLRAQQLKHATAPTHRDIARVLIARLQSFPLDEGLDDVSLINRPVAAQEEEDVTAVGTPEAVEAAERRNIPPGVLVPESLQRKVARCQSGPVDVLLERGLITSGETLARVLPQMTAGINAAGFADPTLRRLFSTIYSAFRHRRSLLLLDLEPQVQLEELPWIAAIDRFRRNDAASREGARQALREVALLSIAAFPQTILPNKLLRELHALAKTAQLDLPLVDEVAADIFMGEFSGKFLEAAQRAANVLEGTLYATYYEIDYPRVRRLRPVQFGHSIWPWLKQAFTQTRSNAFAEHCAERAGVRLDGGDAAGNGMVIEQQQIVTTQNLAVLFAELHLAEPLQGRLDELPRRCFTRVCAHLQLKADQRHARLIRIKKAAYAWRQMIFFLALLPRPAVDEFLGWAEEHFGQQPEGIRQRFRPALIGLALAAEGRSLDSEGARQAGARRFLGWSRTRHWLLPED